MSDYLPPLRSRVMAAAYLESLINSVGLTGPYRVTLDSNSLNILVLDRLNETQVWCVDYYQWRANDGSLHEVRLQTVVDGLLDRSKSRMRITREMVMKARKTALEGKANKPISVIQPPLFKPEVVKPVNIAKNQPRQIGEPIDEKQFALDYAGGMLVKSMAEKYTINNAHVYRLIHKLGLPLRGNLTKPSGRPKKSAPAKLAEVETVAPVVLKRRVMPDAMKQQIAEAELEAVPDVPEIIMSEVVRTNPNGPEPTITLGTAPFSFGIKPEDFRGSKEHECAAKQAALDKLCKEAAKPVVIQNISTTTTKKTQNGTKVTIQVGDVTITIKQRTTK